MLPPVPSLAALASGLPAEVQKSLQAALRAQDEFNRRVLSAFEALTEWTWLNPRLQNGWRNFSDALHVRFTKTASGTVYLSGGVTSGTLGLTAFELPDGYRPSQDMNLTTWSNGELPSKLFISPAGSVIPQAGDTALLSIECSFLADA